MGDVKEYILEGLSCPHCGAKIEEEAGRLPEVSEASLNMLNCKLSVCMKDNEASDVTDKIKNIVKAHEPSVKVVNISDSAEASSDEEDKKEESLNVKLYLIRLGFVLTVTIVFSFIKVAASVKLAAFIIAYLLSGYEIILAAARNIRKGKVFDENFLMGIASLGAFIMGDMAEAVSVLVFYGIGELIQDRAVQRSKRNIEGLMDIRPDYANLKDGASYKVVDPGQVKAGDVILVKPGEKIPLDGTVIKGNSFIDTRALTGESVPAEVTVNDTVLSGAINTSGVLEIEVTKPYSESTVSKILELVRNSGSKKAESEKFITRFAGYYTPAVVFTAAAVAFLPPLLGLGTFGIWIYRALSFLIISCPCALVISIPLSFFGGIGGAARNGILIKGGNYLDALNKVDTIVFDKTGTLTKGVFEVAGVYPAEGANETELLRLAAAAESRSTHPIAKSIQSYYQRIKSKETNTTVIEESEGGSIISEDASDSVQITEKAGYGIIAGLDRGTILAGNDKLMQENGIDCNEPSTAGSIIHVAFNGRYYGYILIADEIKKDTDLNIKELKKYKVKRTVMLTGDRKDTAEAVARQCLIDEFHAELLPQDKVTLFEQYKKSTEAGGKIVFVGDGINDAPVLAGADIGIAMGGIGSDAAIEAADVVIMNDDIGRIVTALKVAGKTKAIVNQNIVFALGTKILIMLLAFLGITSIWFAIFADVGVALIALFNAMRAMRIR